MLFHSIIQSLFILTEDLSRNPSNTTLQILVSISHRQNSIFKTVNLLLFSKLQCQEKLFHYKLDNVVIKVWNRLSIECVVGFEFWKRMCNEHGIGPDGVHKDIDSPVLDMKDVFFYQVSC